MTSAAALQYALRLSLFSAISAGLGGGSYSIIDIATDTPIIPFSEYTKLSCDSTSLYFDQILNTFEPGRFYKILFKVIYDDGQEIIYDNDELSKDDQKLVANVISGIAGKKYIETNNLLFQKII